MTIGLVGRRITHRNTRSHDDKKILEVTVSGVTHINRMPETVSSLGSADVMRQIHTSILINKVNSKRN